MNLPYRRIPKIYIGTSLLGINVILLFFKFTYLFVLFSFLLHAILLLTQGLVYCLFYFKLGESKKAERYGRKSTRNVIEDPFN